MPERRNLPSINIKPREMPFDQIISVKGRNPVGESLPMFGKVLSDAMVQRANLIKMGQQTAAIEKAMGAAPGALNGMDPEQGLQFAKMQNELRLQEMKQQREQEKQIRSVFVSDFKRNPEPYLQFEQGGGKLNFINDLSEGVRGDNLERRDRTLRWQITNGFKSEPGVANLYTNLQDANRVEGLLTQNNPIADNAVRFYIAQQVQGGGVLSNQDIAELGGSKSILDRIDQIIAEKTSGRLSDANRAYYNKLTEKLKSGALKNLDLAARQYVVKNVDDADIIFPGGRKELYDKLMGDVMSGGFSQDNNFVPGQYNTSPNSIPISPQVQSSVPVNSGIALSGPSAQRLAELRAKKASGTLR